MSSPTIVNEARVVRPMSADDIAVSDHVLTTTRSIRRRLDLTRPVDPGTIEECIRVATHAPSAENMQNWRWVIVTDSALRETIADCYRKAYLVHRSGSGGRVRRKGKATRDSKVIESVGWLADNVGDVPALVIPCSLGRPPKSGTLGNRGRADLDHMANVVYYGSVLPAIWSFQLALRTRRAGIRDHLHAPALRGGPVRALGHPARGDPDLPASRRAHHGGLTSTRASRRAGHRLERVEQ